MPVEDHPIHPSTQKGADFRYGCWNHAPYADGYIAHPWSRAVYVPHVMSTDCKYDIKNDPSCEGCKHKEITMTREEKDAICQLWIEVFGTQEGAGYNCPQGAYDFYEVVRAFVLDECAASIQKLKDKKDGNQE